MTALMALLGFLGAALIGVGLLVGTRTMPGKLLVVVGTILAGVAAVLAVVAVAG